MTKALREKLARGIRVVVAVQGIRRWSFSTTSAWRAGMVAEAGEWAWRLMTR
jgi:hypothetical protein